jgi:hypothetical protein
VHVRTERLALVLDAIASIETTDTGKRDRRRAVLRAASAAGHAIDKVDLANSIF